MGSFRLVLVLLFSIHCAYAQTSDEPYYTAGVVEFRPNLMGMTSAEMLADHLRSYEEIIRSQEANSTDIIVFPEGTLNNMFHLTFVPAAIDDIIPCLQSMITHDNGEITQYADFFIKLSCIARDVKKYLVINLTEKENCTSTTNDPRPCATSGLNIYNTNVVFDREGRIISRYRKVHIYVEAKNTTLRPEFGIFDTDFDVRFGHFICFDILFYTPAQEMVDRFGVQNFIFTSLFYSELPFLTATQLQQSWAWGNNVNLLAAGASYPQAGITGTGIYVGNNGHSLSVMVGGGGVRKLYVAKVPKSPPPLFSKNNKKFLSESPSTLQSTQSAIRLMKDPQIASYKSELLDFFNEQIVSRSMCDGDFCCFAQIKVSYSILPVGSVFYKYRLGVFDGRRTYEKEEWSDIKVCALYACTSDDVNSCGELFNSTATVVSNVVFEYISVKAFFPREPKVLIMPNTLNDQLYSLNSDAVKWFKTIEGASYVAHMELIEPQDKLLTFGIYSHYYEKSSGSVAEGNIFGHLITLTAIFISLNGFGE